MRYIWPLKDTKPLFPDEVGCYGVFRRFDRHIGVDLYCEIGTEVVAVEDGRVVAVEGFTGPNADDPSPWWNDTQAILVEGKSGVITYGEVLSQVDVGQEIKQGEVIATVRPVLKENRGRPMVMLHFELMTHGSVETQWGRLKAPLEDCLRDPTNLLLEAAGEELEFFRMIDYDGKQFIDPSAPLQSSPWWVYLLGDKVKTLLTELFEELG